MDEQHEFEKFLRSFRPAQPSALPQIRVPREKSVWFSRSAAVTTLGLAATIAICAIAMHRTIPTGEQAGREPMDRQDLSSVVLTRLALENPDRFDRVVTQKRLPRFDRTNTALHSLARE